MTCPESPGVCAPHSRCWAPFNHLLLEGKPPPPSYRGAQSAWPGHWRHMLDPSWSIPTTLTQMHCRNQGGPSHEDRRTGACPFRPASPFHQWYKKESKFSTMRKVGGEKHQHQWKTRGVRSAHVTSVGPTSSPTDLVIFFVTL